MFLCGGRGGDTEGPLSSAGDGRARTGLTRGTGRLDATLDDAEDGDATVGEAGAEDEPSTTMLSFNEVPEKEEALSFKEGNTIQPGSPKQRDK